MNEQIPFIQGTMNDFQPESIEGRAMLLGRDFLPVCGPRIELTEKILELVRDAEAAAINAERERWKAFADERGEPRKVHGDLPILASGEICGVNSTIYRPNNKDGGLWCASVSSLHKDRDENMTIVQPPPYWSSESAALAAVRSKA